MATKPTPISSKGLTVTIDGRSGSRSIIELEGSKRILVTEWHGGDVSIALVEGFLGGEDWKVLATRELKKPPRWLLRRVLDEVAKSTRKE